jgi:Putative zinc-finger
LAIRPIELDCEEVWRHLSDYIDEDVSAELRASMVLHFKDCAHCTAVLDGTRNVVQLVGDGKAFEVPPPVSQRLYAKLNQYLAGPPSNHNPRR